MTTALPKHHPNHAYQWLTRWVPGNPVPLMCCSIPGSLTRKTYSDCVDITLTVADRPITLHYPKSWVEGDSHAVYSSPDLQWSSVAAQVLKNDLLDNNRFVFCNITEKCPLGCGAAGCLIGLRSDARWGYGFYHMSSDGKSTVTFTPKRTLQGCLASRAIPLIAAAAASSSSSSSAAQQGSSAQVHEDEDEDEYTDDGDGVGDCDMGTDTDSDMGDGADEKVMDTGPTRLLDEAMSEFNRCTKRVRAIEKKLDGAQTQLKKAREVLKARHAAVNEKLSKV